MQIPEIVYELDLEVEEIALYGYMMRRAENGRLEMSIGNISREIGVSAGTVSIRIKKLLKPKDCLNGKSLLTLEREKGSGPFTYYITDISEENSKLAGE